jgi:hypothetical protein
VPAPFPYPITLTYRRITINRTAISATVINLGILGIIVCIGASPRHQSNDIEAKSLTLRDDNGQARAVLALSGEDDDPILSLLDNQGKHRLQLEVGADSGSNLTFYNGQEEPRLSIHAGNDGNSAIRFEGEDGSDLSLKLEPDQSIGLIVHGKDAKGSMEYTYNYKTDTYGYSMLDASNKTRHYAYSFMSGEQIIAIAARNGGSRIQLTIDDQGDPKLSIINQEGEITAELPLPQGDDNN